MTSWGVLKESGKPPTNTIGQPLSAQETWLAEPSYLFAMDKVSWVLVVQVCAL
jgi:hypothetical protein